MADPRMSFRSTGGRSLYSVDEEGGEEEYSYYDDEEEYYDDDEEYYDDEEQYSPRGGGRGGDNRFNNSAMRSTNRYSANNHRGGGRGGGGGRELVEYDDGDDYDSYADDYYDDRGGGGGGRGRGGRHYGGNYNSRGNNRRGSRNNNSGERKLVSILPGTPKQAQDIIRQYSLGMPLKYATHMALPPTTPPEGPAREIATLQVANLVPQEYAFVRRSNGQWSFAQLAVRHDSLEQMVFIVNKGGSTKTFKRFEWPGFVRRIKWTERRVQLPPKPLKEIPNGNTGAEGTGQQQLALENGNTKSSSAPNNPAAQQSDKPQQPEVSTMTIKEMKIELQQLGIDFSLFMEKQEFRNAVIDARAEAVKNALIREQQMQHRQEEEEKQQHHHNHQQHQNNNNNNNNINDDHGFDNFNEINLTSTLDADLSNLAGQVITLQPQDDEVSELMGDYLLTEYKFQMKVLERERLKNQGAANKMTSINEHGSGNGNVGDGQQSSAYQSGLGQQSSAYQSFNIEGEGDKKLPHYEKMAFAKSQKWGSVSEEV